MDTFPDRRSYREFAEQDHIRYTCYACGDSGYRPTRGGPTDPPDECLCDCATGRALLAEIRRLAAERRDDPTDAWMDTIPF
jgi:hypothetical protein